MVLFAKDIMKTKYIMEGQMKIFTILFFSISYCLHQQLLACDVNIIQKLYSIFYKNSLKLHSEYLRYRHIFFLIQLLNTHKIEVDDAIKMEIQ